MNTIRTGSNSEDYRLGNRYELNSWLSYGWSDTISTSVRLSGHTTGTISGLDEELNPMMVTTADPANYGGERLYAGIGLNLLFPEPRLALAFEAGMPVYQNYNGIFMDQDFGLNTSIKYTIL